jgi:hypothetical protein
MTENDPVTVRPGESPTITGRAIGPRQLPPEAAAAIAAAMEAARDPGAARQAGADAGTGIFNLSGVTHIRDSTVTGPDGAVQYIAEATLGAGGRAEDEFCLKRGRERGAPSSQQEGAAQ